MHKLAGLIRKAVTDYNMIEPNDVLVVGVSGGKDSMALLLGLSKLRAYLGIPFTLKAVTLDPCFYGEEADYSAIAEICEREGIEYRIKRTDFYEIIFNIRKEKNPCSLCARMRRGCLHDTVKEMGGNKLVLGHHQDDAVETLMMNLFIEGRLGCFAPVSYLSRKDIHMIRPLIYTRERYISSVVERLNIPIVKSKCPVDGVTSRQKAKEQLLEMEKNDPHLFKRLFGAIKGSKLDGWDVGN